MVEKGLTYSADAIGQSEVSLVNNELQIAASKQFQLDPSAKKFSDRPEASRLSGPPLQSDIWRNKAAPLRLLHPKPKPALKEDEVTERALAHPEVQRFRELFGGEVRTVRNLKENLKRMKMPGNMQAMMQQAQKMQEKLQAEVALIRVEATAGGGMVTVKMDGHKHVLGVKIDPEVAGDVEMLQDLVLAAVNEAAQKVDEESQKKMGGMLGGMSLPPGLF